jgi:hypothetical protein
MRLLTAFRKALRAAVSGVQRDPQLITVLAEELPELLVANAIYLIGERDQYWQAALRCPCPCGDLIQLNLLPPAHPSGRFVGSKTAR